MEHNVKHDAHTHVKLGGLEGTHCASHSGTPYIHSTTCQAGAGVTLYMQVATRPYETRYALNGATGVHVNMRR